MPYVKGRDGKARTINNPLEGSVGDIDLNNITADTLSASGNVTGAYLLGNGYLLAGLTTSQLTNDAGFITSATANVISVNGQTGTLTLTIPTTTSNLINDSGYITSATANVISVNGQTGAVTITAGGNVDSVNGQTGNVVLSTSNLTNDSGYITSATANVVSVNGQTGTVTVPTDAANVAYSPAVANNWSWANAAPNDAAEGLDDLALIVKNILSGSAVFAIAGPFSNDANAGAGGVPIGGIYYNASGGLVVRRT